MWRYLLLTCAALVLTAVLPWGALAADTRALVIGKVSDNPKKDYLKLKPMVDYIVEHMADLGITEGKVLMAKDNAQMVRYLRQGRVDWVTETPFSAAHFKEKAGAQYLLRKWKKGVPSYHALIFSRKDSGIRSLEDLRGRTVAFEDPGSTSAFFLPASVLLQRGLELVRLDSPRLKPPADKVGYVFSGEEVNTFTWVQKGMVDAGALNNLDWEKEDHLSRNLLEGLEVLHRTADLPRAVELVRGDMPTPVKERLKALLLGADGDPGGRRALSIYQQTAKFDELDASALAALEEAGRQVKRVNGEIN